MLELSTLLNAVSSCVVSWHNPAKFGCQIVATSWHLARLSCRLLIVTWHVRETRPQPAEVEIVLTSSGAEPQDLRPIQDQDYGRSLDTIREAMNVAPNES